MMNKIRLSATRKESALLKKMREAVTPVNKKRKRCDSQFVGSLMVRRLVTQMSLENDSPMNTPTVDPKTRKIKKLKKS
jgi:hypothetical protein